MKRGDVFWNDHADPLRGSKPGYYVIVGRRFVRDYPMLRTITCAPVHSEVLGTDTEVVIDTTAGVHHRSSVRCDLLMQVAGVSSVRVKRYARR